MDSLSLSLSLARASLKTTCFLSAAIQFPRARHYSKRTGGSVGQRQGVKVSTRNGRHDTKCLSAKRLRMVREDTGAPNEGATCAWMAAYETVGFTRVFRTMWRSSRRLVCRGRLEPGLRVNDICQIHWSNTSSQHNQSGLIDELLA
ncbi:uncharacterized protein TNCV_3440941 [Trichonephila clavipes]|uniref:Uncharacterized protein n=1 Tax=Trichonephila clavipes TaxID=2585209 RepID=A0A8X7BFQ6_TRICX|nr:uncharacterized protein TNCV_3440941 [Trichonephila clavipes]